MSELTTLKIERVFNAPVERVWEAWSDPDEMRKWWGPKGFTAPTVEIDFREGGKTLLSMSSPNYENGREIFSAGVYTEITPYRRIVTTDSFANEAGETVSASEYGMSDTFPEELLVTINFEEVEEGKTKLTIHHEGMPADEAADAEQGWQESLDKLAAIL